MTIENFPFSVFICLPHIEDTTILGDRVSKLIPYVLDEVKNYQYEDIPDTFSSITYNTYLKVSSMDPSSYDGMSEIVKHLLPDVPTPSVKQAFDVIYSYIHQRDEFMSLLPDFPTPVIGHCPQMVKFNELWSVQSSISNVANEWHCSWDDVIASKAVDVLEVLSFLGAKSSAEYYEFKYNQQKH